MAFDLTNVDVEEFLQALDIRNLSRATSNEWRFSCPYSAHYGGDAHPSAYMNDHTTAFHCHSCKESGNAVSLAAHVLGVSRIEAIRLLRERYQPGAMDPDSISMVEELRKIMTLPERAPEQPVLPESTLDRFATDWHMAWEARPLADKIFEYMFERGFTPQVLEAWDFGYDPLSHRITFPVRDEEGHLVGFKARAHDDRHPKYLVLGDSPHKPPRYGFPRYFPSRVVFGAHRLVFPAEELIVCEGELNAIAIDQKLGRPAVAINGSHFTEAHARILRRRADSVVLFLDSDDAGSTALWGHYDARGEHHPGIVQALSPFMDVRIVPDHDGDPASMDKDSLASVIDGARSALYSRMT